MCQCYQRGIDEPYCEYYSNLNQKQRCTKACVFHVLYSMCISEAMLAEMCKAIRTRLCHSDLTELFEDERFIKHIVIKFQSFCC